MCYVTWLYVCVLLLPGQNRLHVSLLNLISKLKPRHRVKYLTVPCVDVMLAVALVAALELLGSEETDVSITLERTLRNWGEEQISTTAHIIILLHQKAIVKGYILTKL